MRLRTSRAGCASENMVALVTSVRRGSPDATLTADMVLRMALAALSPAGPRARLSTLIFHRVLPVADPLFPDEVDRDRFDALCGWLRAWFQVLPLDQALSRLRDGSLPSRALAISFDDGYADNHEVALPVLQRHGLSATFFVASAFLDGGRMWNDSVIEALRRTSKDRIQPGDLDGTLAQALPELPLVNAGQRRAAIDRVLGAVKYLEPARRQRAVDALVRQCAVALPDDLMMSGRQVQQLRQAGMGIGAHTLTHPILARLGDDEARSEILRGRDELQRLLGERIALFAYPNGKPGQDYSERSIELVREAGFDAAVSTAAGVATAASDRFQIPRFTPWDRQRLRFGLRLARNLMRGT